MSDYDSPTSGTRDSDRVAIETRVDLEFQSFQGFLTEYSSNLSIGGMFVNSAEPSPPGTMLTFNLRLEDFQLVQGFGQVMWIRPKDEGPGLPAGMGIRFLELEGNSVELIQRIIDQRLAEGGETFDLNAPEGEVSSIELHPQIDAHETASDDQDMGRGEAIPWPPPPEAPDPDATLLPISSKLSGSGELMTDAGDPGALAAEDLAFQDLAFQDSGLQESDLGEAMPSAASPRLAPLGEDGAADEPEAEEANAVGWPGAQESANQWPPKVPPPESEISDALTGIWGDTATWKSSDTGTAGVRTLDPEQGLMEEIFVPPEVGSQPRPKRPASRRPTASAGRWKPSPVVVMLMVFSAFVGAFAYRYHEELVAFAGGFDNASIEPTVYDVPPPATLESVARRNQENEATTAGQAGSAGESGDVPAVGSGAEPAGDAQASTTVVGEGAEAVGAAPVLGPVGPEAERLDQVRLITWKRQPAEQATVITLWGNGQLRPQDLDHTRLDGRPPRELLKLRGINWPFRDPILDANTNELRRIRTGFHPKATGNELHIVLDLQDPKIRLSRIERDGNKLLLVLSP